MVYYIRYKLKEGKQSFVLAQSYRDLVKAQMMVDFHNARKPNLHHWLVDTTTEVATQTEAGGERPCDPRVEAGKLILPHRESGEDKC